MAANEEQRRRMLAMLLRIPPKNALQHAAPQQPSNWLSKPLPMEGRFGLLPIQEQVPGMGPSLFNKRELAMPGLLAGAVNAFTAPGRAANAQPGFKTDEEALNMALSMFGGGLLAPRPRGSIGMGGREVPKNVKKFPNDPLMEHREIARAIQSGELSKHPTVSRMGEPDFKWTPEMQAAQERITAYWKAKRAKDAGMRYDRAAYLRGPVDPPK
jgi:hypothetical protein